MILPGEIYKIIPMKKQAWGLEERRMLLSTLLSLSLYFLVPDDEKVAVLLTLISFVRYDAYQSEGWVVLSTLSTRFLLLAVDILSSLRRDSWGRSSHFMLLLPRQKHMLHLFSIFFLGSRRCVNLSNSRSMFLPKVLCKRFASLNLSLSRDLNNCLLCFFF